VTFQQQVLTIEPAGLTDPVLPNCHHPEIIDIAISKQAALDIWQNRKSTRLELHIYTDGSRHSARSGYGCLIEQNPTVSIKHSLPHWTSIATAELSAILMSLTWTHSNTPPQRHIHLWTDSKSGLQMLQKRHDRFNGNLIKQIWTAIHVLISLDYRITLHWIPGHFKIPGNETADTLAKDGVFSEACPLTTANDLRMIQQEMKLTVLRQWQAQWQQGTRGQYYRNLIQKPSLRHPSSLLLSVTSKANCHRLMKFWTGDNFLALSRYKYKKIGTYSCHCGAAIETVRHHLSECPDFADIRERYLGHIPRRILCDTKRMLLDKRYINDTANFLVHSTHLHMQKRIHWHFETSRPSGMARRHLTPQRS
jgi:ribonuclease HI